MGHRKELGHALFRIEENYLKLFEKLMEISLRMYWKYEQVRYRRKHLYIKATNPAEQSDGEPPFRSARANVQRIKRRLRTGKSCIRGKKPSAPR